MLGSLAIWGFGEVGVVSFGLLLVGFLFDVKLLPSALGLTGSLCTS